MRIAIAQLNYHVGNFQNNVTKIIAALDKAKQQGADLVVFAEMAVTGYPAKDLWLSPDFMEKSGKALEEIASHCQGIACIVGTAVENHTGVGKPLFNVAVLLEDGKVADMARKGLVPDYDVFDEYRYFQPASDFRCLHFRAYKLAVSVCEDMWNLTEPSLYGLSNDPMPVLAAEKPDLSINIAASPFAPHHFEERQEVMRTHALRAGSPLLYVNQVGAHADLIFDGRSLVYSGEGEMLAELAAFEEDFRVYEFAEGRLQATEELSHGYQAETPRSGQTNPDTKDPIALIHQALILGIRDFFQKSGFRKAILGLSGGLDSAVVAVLACEALGPENVLAVLMPSVYSSDHSIRDAEDLVAFNGCESLTIPIHEPTIAFLDVLAEAFEGTRPDTTEENIQARTRAVILMALSNKFGHVLLNTSNKSEAAVGYGTLYGDMAGSLSVIGDIFKTDVYQLAHYLNRERERVPVHTIQKPPSAELRPDQKDSDSLPDYPVLDAVLRAYIEENEALDSIKQQIGDGALVDRIVDMVGRAEFKRFQSPPILRVSKKAFGPGRAMPLVAKRG